MTIDTGKDRWVDERFADLARRTQAAARDLGLRADTSRLRFVQVGIDAIDIPAVRAFWQTVLGYDAPRPELTDIYDPRQLNLPLFFQPMQPDQARARQRNRLNLELLVPDLQPRLDAALTTGGRILHQAPIRVTLTDPENNELTLITPDR